MEYTYERFKSFHGKSPAPYGDRAAADRGHRHDRAAPFAGPRRAAGCLSQPRAHGCGHAPAERLRLLRGQPVRADLRLRRQRTVSSGAAGRAFGAGMVYRRGADGAFVAADPGHGGGLAHGSFADRLPGVLVSDGLFRPVCAVPRPARCRGAAFPPSADVDAAGLRRPVHPDALCGGIAGCASCTCWVPGCGGMVRPPVPTGSRCCASSSAWESRADGRSPRCCSRPGALRRLWTAINCCTTTAR